MSKKKFWTSDKLVALVALSISLLTLIIFVRQTNIMDKQSRLSVMPYLLFETTKSYGTKTLNMRIKNHGVGPAIIDKVVIHHQGKTFQMDLAEYAANYLLKRDSIPVLSDASINPGLAIPAEGERLILVIGGEDEKYKKALQLLANFEKENFDCEIYYHSIYDDHWKLVLSEDTPIAL